MLDQPQNDTVRRLAKLRATFESGLDGRFLGIKDDFDRASSATKKGQATDFLSKIKNAAHKLSGSGGIHGFPAVSGMAKSLEQACCRALEHEEQAIPAAAMAEIKDCIDALAGTARPASTAFGESISFDDIMHRLKSIPGDEKTVLLIDDDLELAASLKAQLSVFGFEMVWEEDPERLADSLASLHPAAVIMDISFPGDEDRGLVVINELRERGSIDCPVLFLSNRSDIEARLGAYRAGCSDYLVKPFDISDLVSSLVQRVAARTQEPYRVLIIDDDPDVSEYHQVLLEQAGFNVLSLNDPMSALKAVDAFLPDGILLDVHMPGCSGIEVAAVLRQDQNLLHVPIIFLTSDTDQVRKLSAVLSGGDEFLIKNSAPDYIVATLKTRSQRSRELKRKIERIGQSENHFRSLAQKVADAIVSIDQEGRIVQWNQGATGIFGYREDEILGISIQTLFPDRIGRTQIDAMFDADVQEKNQGCLFSAFQTGAMTKNRGEIAVELSVNHWNDDEQWHCTAIIRDVTERNKTEQELRKNKERFRTMAEQSSDWIWESDIAHKFTYISEGLSKSIGIPRDKFLGRKRGALTGVGVSKESLNNHLDDLRRHLPFRNFEYGIETDSGAMVYLSSSGAPQFSDDGAFEGYIGTGRNVTQLKLSQAELQNKIDTATKELSAKSKKLERALKQEKRLNQAQRQFVSMASHEFRTPLAIIDSTAQRLTSLTRKFGEDQELDRKIAKIRNAVDRLTTLIESTLASENIDSGKTEFNAQTCGLRSLVIDICERQQEITDTHTIIFDLDQLPVRITADNGKLEQIFSNLLSNAVKYSPDADRIEVRGWQERGQAVISVTDHGLGIPDGEQPRIFERFFRASSSLGIVGTGIGLYLVKEFVALHSGSLDMDSKEGVGTTIAVRLPMNLLAGHSMEPMAI